MNPDNVNNLLYGTAAIAVFGAIMVLASLPLVMKSQEKDWTDNASENDIRRTANANRFYKIGKVLAVLGIMGVLCVKSIPPAIIGR